MNETPLENVLKRKELQNEEKKLNETETTSREIIVIDIEENVTEKANLSQFRINDMLCMNLRETNTTPMQSDRNRGPQIHEYKSKETHESAQVTDQNDSSRTRRFGHTDMKSDPVGEPLEYEPTTRNTFLRLVFGIVIVMLIAVALFNFLVLQSEQLKRIFRIPFVSLIPGFVLSLVVHYAFGCLNCARFPPWSFVFLFLGVVAMSLITVYFTSRFKTEIVVMALAATAITVFVCFLLAFSNFDFTKYMLYLVVVSIALSAVFLLIMLVKFIFEVDITIIYLVFLVISTLVQAITLTMEIQMIIGGRSIELGTGDYALGAFMVFDSIISLFLDFLIMFNIIDSLLD